MRPELHESEIERQLARRATGEWRAERLLPAVRRQMDEPRTEPVVTSRWAALAALVGLLGVLIVLAVALPRLDLSPAAPSPTPEGGVVVLSTEEFAARLVTGELNGQTVLVEGRIEADDRPAIECSRPLDPCPMGVLAGVEERVQIHAFGVATDDFDEASVYLYSEEPWPHWHMPQPPVEGLLLLSVDDSGRVIYDGRVRLTSAELSTTPADAAELDPTSLSLDELLLVDGWLTQVGGAISCRPPDPGTVLEGLSDKWCGNPAWIGPEPLAVDPTGVVIPDDFNSVQHGAYFGFAEDPTADEQGLLVPRRATYALARRLYGGGCPDNSPPCWDWQIIARLAVSPAHPIDTPVPSFTPAPETPTPEPPSSAITCRPYAIGGMVNPSLDVQLDDWTGSAIDCAYFSEFATLPDGQSIQPRWHLPDELSVTWNVAHVCPASARVTLSRGLGRYLVTVEQPEIDDCGAAPGRQAIVIWFDAPAEDHVHASLLDMDGGPPSPTTRIECEEITAPAQPDSRRGEAVIIDHSGVVDGSCQWFRAVPSEGDQVTVINPTESQTLLQITWPVPMVCDYMPVELEIWWTAEGLLVHIDRKGIINPEMQGCRMVVGRQGVALNLAEPMMATSVETVLTIEGAAMSVVDMPATGEAFTLSLAAAKTEYVTGETIEFESVLSYDAVEGATIEVWGPGYSGLIAFGFDQLDGDLGTPPVSTADCGRYELRQREPLRQPYSFPQLPPGTYRIRAVTSPSGGCGEDGTLLDASIVITVR